MADTVSKGMGFWGISMMMKHIEPCGFGFNAISLTLVFLLILSAVASQSEAMGAGLEQCIVGHPASVTIVTRDKSGGACKSGNAILSAEVHSTPKLHKIKFYSVFTLQCKQ